MFPWNLFNSHKSNPLNEQNFQQMLEQWMRQTFPFYQHPNNKNQRQHSSTHSNLNEVVFETHENIYIRIPIRNEEKLDHIKVFYSLNKCLIKGLTENELYTIILPATVKKKGAKAVYRDEILEIKIPKNIDWQYSEIDVDKD